LIYFDLKYLQDTEMSLVYQSTMKKVD